MKRRMAVLALAVVALAVSNLGHAEEGNKPQTTCPVMGGEIDKAVFIDHEGMRVYFCCNGCDTAFNEDTEKYLKAMEEDGVTVERRQTKCPIMKSRDINTSLYLDHEGTRIYVCCKGCIGRVERDVEKHLEEFDKAGITLEKRQTLCPIEGEEIDRNHHSDHEGNRVYMCSKHCVETFNEDASAHVKDLLSQSITLDQAPASTQHDHDAQKKGHSGGCGGCGNH